MPRKLDVGAVLSKIFATYREYLSTLLTLAIGVALIEALFRLTDNWILVLVGIVVSIIVNALFTGAVVELVNDTRDGQLDQSIGALVGQVTPVLFTLIIASFLAGVMTLLGVIACIVGIIAVYTLVAVTAPVIVVERLGAIDAITRSWKMVWPNFWPALGVIAVCWLLGAVVGNIVGQAFGAGVVGAIVAFVVYLFVAPLGALASATLYFEILAIERAAPATVPPPVGGLSYDAPPPPAGI